MNDFWDTDIATLNLPDVEKKGLQVFRNYTKAFEKSAAQKRGQKRGQVDFLSESASLHGPSQYPVFRRHQARVPPAQSIQLNR